MYTDTQVIVLVPLILMSSLDVAAALDVLTPPQSSQWQDEACKPVGKLNLACRSVLKFKLKSN